MKILPNIEIIDLALYFKATLVIADIHIGYEEALNKQGILVPRLQFEEMIKRMEKVFGMLNNKKLKRIVVNGDLKHEFGTISEQEWRNTLKFIDLLAKHCKEVILIKGNHDTILGPIAKKRNVKVVDSLAVGKVLITHGNKVPGNIKSYDTLIIGHEHPAISIREGPRVEQFKCFLKGRYKGKNLIVQPSFNSMIEGTDLLRDKILSPFLHQNLDNFDVYIVEDKVYEFGKLKKFR
ncbi:metallophosphoesterase [Candidatus Woesearchaeota archaeon]|nr:metallophosphoesterase [Candidatus Woesearchaeota archaeon]